MKEKVLNNKKNGMAMMLLFLLLYAVGVGAIAFGAVQEVIPVMVVGIGSYRLDPLCRIACPEATGSTGIDLIW